MIDRSDIVVFFTGEDEKSGAYKAYKYAKRKNKEVYNFFVEAKIKDMDI